MKKMLEHLINVIQKDEMELMFGKGSKIFIESVTYSTNAKSYVIHSKVFGKSKFRICSRRFELHDKKNDWYKVFTDTNFKEEIAKLVKHFKTDDIIVQGEAIGKFNGNHHNLQKEHWQARHAFSNHQRDFW